MRSDTPEPLKLVALDHEDLKILSAHLQDAVLRMADMVTCLPNTASRPSSAASTGSAETGADGGTPICADASAPCASTG